LSRTADGKMVFMSWLNKKLIELSVTGNKTGTHRSLSFSLFILDIEAKDFSTRSLLYA
jgi:hypothetical protein